MELETVTQPGTPFAFADFLRGLFTDGEARVIQGPPPPVDAAASERLILAEIAMRADLPGPPPPFSLEVARWAATVFYCACQFVLCRDVGEQTIVTALKAPCPMDRNPSTDWSADVVFQYLPEVFRRARHLSRNDPLVREVEYLGATWPLSSVGIPDLGGLEIETFWRHPTLARLYIDRILKRVDLSRLGNPAVDERLKAALGGHPELCPAIAKGLGLESL